MQYFLEFGKEIFIGDKPLTWLLFPLWAYLGICVFSYLLATSFTDGRFGNWIKQKLGSSKKACLALFMTFVFLIFKFYTNLQIDKYTDQIKLFNDESSFFATCFGSTLLFISLLLLFYAKGISTKLQWKKWIFIPLFIVVQLPILFFATAALYWETDCKYGDIKTSSLDDRLKSMGKYYDYEIIVNTEDIFFPRDNDASPFTKKTSLNLRVQGDSVCLIGQEELRSLLPDREIISSTSNSGTCKWIAKDSKEANGVKNFAKHIRSYEKEYFISNTPFYFQPTEIILLDYNNNKQKRLLLPFAHERVPKATKILKEAIFYLDYWEQFKPQSVENSQNTEESDK